MADVIDLVDIGTAIDDRVESYSGGMKRRLDLAMSLIHRPEILFLDEPTTGLDPSSRAAVWTEVRRLNREFGMTIFLTTQYLEEADELADRVGIINAGKIVAEGTPAELKRSIGTDVVTAVVDGEVEAGTGGHRAKSRHRRGSLHRGAAVEDQHRRATRSGDDPIRRCGANGTGREAVEPVDRSSEASGHRI